MKSLIRFRISLITTICLLAIRGTHSMIHHLDFKGDNRMLVHLSTFGFGMGGNLTVTISNLVPPEKAARAMMGLTLDRTTHSQQNEFLPWDEQVSKCKLSSLNNASDQVVVFWIDFTKKRIRIEKIGETVVGLNVGNTPRDFIQPDVTLSNQRKGAIQETRRKRTAGGVPFFESVSDTFLFSSRRRRGVDVSGTTTDATTTATPTAFVTTTAAAVSTGAKPAEQKKSNSMGEPNKFLEVKDDFNGTVDSIPLVAWNLSGITMYNASFSVRIVNETEEGIYNLAFHNCLRLPMNMTVWMMERNGKYFLAIGEAPLPLMYFIFFLASLTAAIFWHWLLYVSQEGVCRIHYLMLVLMYIKSVSLLFHGINLQFMQSKGQKEEAFAILFYIVYLLKGIVMFLTIVLIGAGWTFVRHILSDRDKKIFVIVIPLQILVNVATIFVEESEQGQEGYTLWKELMIFLDLVCCGAILFPIVGSIRHLQQASQTDGKAAVNLEKLKIFRHFYILVVCFIYFTRIIVLLVGITVPFRYVWLDRFFVELVTIGFFLLTGYKFRPASDNPYLRVSMSDDEEDESESLTKNGALESVTRVNIKQPSRGRHQRRGDVEEGEGSESENDETIQQGDRRSAAEQPLLKQREASHEYD